MNAGRLLALYERLAEAPDAIVRLSRFVLDLAVRGKLVEQDPADEPASELLKRIAAEKARLAKAGEIRKQRILPPVEEPPFDVPENWCWARIREITSDRGQKVPDATFTYIDVTAVDKENGLVIGPKVLGPSEAPSRARKVVQRGDVIYSCVRPYLLNVAVIEGDFDPAPIASTAFAILNGHGFVLPRYLWIVLRSPFMVACVEQNQRGQAYPAINDADFAVLPFPLPPLAEQHRIVGKVDELMALCDQLEASRREREGTRDRLTNASLARLSAPDTDDGTFRSYARFAVDVLPALTARADQVGRLRQTILNLAVRGKLVEQDPADEPASKQISRISGAKSAAKGRKGSRAKGLPALAEIKAEQLPTGWTLVRLDDLAVSMRYGTSIKCDYDEALTPVLRIPNVSSGQVSLEDMKFGPLNEGDREALALMAGDLLMIRSNGSLDIVGRSAVVTPDAEGMSFAGYLVRLCTLNEQLNTRYVWLALNSDAVREQIERPIRSAVGLKNVNLTEFGNLSFWVPPLAEQHRIVAKVDTLTALCDRLEASLNAADVARCNLIESLLHETLNPTGIAVEATERHVVFHSSALDFRLPVVLDPEF